MPSAYFARWHPQLGKEVVVTHGSMGSLHYKSIELSSNGDISCSDLSGPQNNIKIDIGDGDNLASVIRIRHSFNDEKAGADVMYEVHQAGVLKECEVIDTTGAGDAFIGGYLISRIVLNASRDE